MASFFKDEELKDLTIEKKSDDFVELTCGCTSRRYGDAVGRLRVFASGDLRIKCLCTSECDEDELSPADFEKHSGKEVARRWKYNVWVIVKGKKVPLLKTVLLKYYNRASKSRKGQHARQLHRDEFICCTKCNKQRRFRLQTKEECRIYHDAVANQDWKCCDAPYNKISCDDEEERASRKGLRGCSRAALCKGCTTCVCFGCKLCRFPDCSCQTCVDFISNADI